MQCIEVCHGMVVQEEACANVEGNQDINRVVLVC